MKIMETIKNAVRIGALLLVLSACTVLPAPPIRSAPTPATASRDALTDHIAEQGIEYFSGIGRYTVRMPATQIWSALVREKQLLGATVACNDLIAQDNGAYFLVEYCDVPVANIARFTITQTLDQMRDEALKEAAGKLLEEEDILVSGVPGRKLTADSALRGAGGYDGSYWARVFVNGNRVYLVASYVFKENWGNRMAKVQPFLESFSIDTSQEQSELSTPTPAPASSLPPAECPITQPQTPPFVPFNRKPSLNSGEFWYGSDKLWTVVRSNGTWSNLPYSSSSGYTQKVFWWRQGYDVQAEPQPDLKVTGRRLDAPAPPLVASRATNAYADDIGSAMLVGVAVPSAGCWEITGQYRDAKLSFVVWVVP